MKLAESKKAEWEKKLRDAGIMSELEVIQEHTRGDLWELGSQISGNYFFTDEQFIFVGGLAGGSSFQIPYNKITALKACCIGPVIPFMPTGIRVTYVDENGKTKKKKCSVMKRKAWIAYLIEKGAAAGN